MRNDEQMQLSRRSFFRTAGVAGLTAMTGGALLAAPRRAEASVDALIAEKLGSSDVAMEKVIMDTPDKAESGAMVRVPIKVDHPMEAGNFIQELLVVVDNNPKPVVAHFHFLPELGAVEMELRIKMANKSNVRAIAKTNTGKLYGVAKEVDVAAGGCAG